MSNIPLITIDLNDENCIKIKLEGFDHHYELIPSGFSVPSSILFICHENGKKLPIKATIPFHPRRGYHCAISNILSGLITFGG